MPVNRKLSFTSIAAATSHDVLVFDFLSHVLLSSPQEFTGTFGSFLYFKNGGMSLPEDGSATQGMYGVCVRDKQYVFALPADIIELRDN